MNRHSLSNLIALGEGFTTELKRAMPSDLAVENIGSGIRRIRELCREHGVAEPVIDVSEHWGTTIFFRPTAQAENQVGTKPGPSRNPP